MLPGTHSLVAFLQLELFWGYILYYWVLVVVVVVVPVLEPSPPPVAASATPTAELTVLTLVAEELPAETDVAADPAASPTCTGAAHAEVAAKRRYGKNAIQNFFHNNFPSLNEWRFTQNISGGIEYTQLKACELRRGELVMEF